MAANVEGSSISRTIFLITSIGKRVEAGGGGGGASIVVFDDNTMSEGMLEEIIRWRTLYETVMDRNIKSDFERKIERGI
jgi:hypothetical protein